MKQETPKNGKEEKLNERKKAIIRSVVEAHIANGEPVGSKYVVEHELKNCSSATVRNDFAELEKAGYLRQPHTSAGRIPTEKAYRFYVDTLAEHYARTTADISRVYRILEPKGDDFDALMETATFLTAGLTGCTALDMRPKRGPERIRQIELMMLGERELLLVTVGYSGEIRTRTVRTPMPVRVPTLQKLTNLMNSLVVGQSPGVITLQTLMEMEEMMGADSALVTPVFRAFYEAMNESDSGRLHYTGLSRLLDCAEYGDRERLGALLDSLENRDAILDLVSKSDSDRIGVAIGPESGYDALKDLSLLWRPIRRKGRTVGVLGVLGPLRTDYRRVMKTLDEIGESVSVLLGENRRLTAAENPPPKKTKGTSKKDG